MDERRRSLCLVCPAIHFQEDRSDRMGGTLVAVVKDVSLHRPNA